MFTDREIKFYH